MAADPTLLVESYILDLLLVLAGFVYLCGTYIVWPSKWNIPAHLAAGFWFVAYFVPVLIVRVQDSFDPAAYGLFRRVAIFGAFFYVLGLLYARIVMASHSNGNDRDFLPSLRWHNFDGDEDIRLRRLKILALIAIAMMAIAIVVMGFVPILAQDPFAAKFFRGAYGDPYRPVAPLYRTATTVFSVFMVVLAVVAVRRRSTLWIAIFGTSVLFMVATLQRAPAVSGILLALGIWFVAKGRTLPFILVAVGANIGGTLVYELLYGTGILKQPALQAADSLGFWDSVARSAPDVSDAIGFLGHWMRAGEPLTEGRTFWGGLIPGQYFWNPSIWSLTLGNTSVDASKIESGGLRLPVSVWGLVSFGELGAVLIPLLAGIVAGILAIRVRSALPAQDSISCAFILVIYAVLQTTVGQFYELRYYNALALLLVMWVVRKPVPNLTADADDSRAAQVHRMTARSYLTTSARR